MKFAVLAHDAQWEIMRAIPNAVFERVLNPADISVATDADAVFDLTAEAGARDYNQLGVPVFAGSIAVTLSEMNAGANVIRLNAWPGFLEKETWEVAGDITPEIAALLNSLGKKFITVEDLPGLVSPRIVSMIINEAYFAKGDEISSEEDIDTAMKLGTNYPYGPFEWSRKIGVQNICGLLQRLAADDARFTPAPALQKQLITF